MKTINIGLVGAGTVGSGVVTILRDREARFRETLGLGICLKRIVDIRPERFSGLPAGDAVCSADARDILEDRGIDIVVELVGGTGDAGELILEAAARKKHVVTANKALIAEQGPALFEAAEKNGVSIFFEAAVGGAMPVIKTIREAMTGNTIETVKTIINGTCNYILTRMTNEGLDFAEALEAAQEAGFAETDPTLDIGGGDSGHKAAIMASLIHGGYVPFNDIPVEGITAITAQDIAFAAEMGYTIKLLGIIRGRGGAVEVRVHPVMLNSSHILASVSNEYNAVLLVGDAAGQILLYGKGAGCMPTASAVVGDIVDIARNIAGKAPRRIPMNAYRAGNALRPLPWEEIGSRYYLRFSVVDRPGVLASIAAVLGAKSISIASVMQKEGFSDECVPVIILTHEANEKDVRDALREIEKGEYVRAATRVIRIDE